MSDADQRRTFRSDNNAGVCPEALEALVRAAGVDHAVAYGDDECTADAVSQFRRLFGEETAVFFVPTGTIANTLLIASLTQPWQQVLCHRWSHYNDDESTAPERVTQCRTATIDSPSSKLTPDDVERASACSRGDVHQPQPGALTISNPTEFGEVYTPDETHALCKTAHALGYRVHVDGARFANAVAHLGCDPKALTIDAGVDALSFGGTKNGLAIGEAALLFPQGDAKAHRVAKEVFPFHRKSFGALLSKHRCVTAPFAATLRDGAWLKHASHANAMATRLAEGLAGAGYTLLRQTQANAVFVELPGEADAALQAMGHAYYMFGEPSWRQARLMCSFDTKELDVDAFITDAAAVAKAGSAADDR